MPLLSAFSGTFFGSSTDTSMRAVVLNNMISAAPMLSYARFFAHAGNAIQLIQATSNNITNLAIRDINTEPSAVQPPPPNYITTGLRIFHAKIQSDIAYEFQNPGNLAAYHQRNLETYAQAMGRNFTDRFINDDPAALPADARRWTGLKRLTALTTPSPELALAGGSGTRTVPFGGANGSALPNDDSSASKKIVRQFLELADQVDSATVSSGGGTKVVFMNEALAYRLASLGLPYLQLSNTLDLLSQPLQIGTWKGYPVIRTGKTHDLASDVIPTNETVGTSTDCTSMYFATFNEEADLTFNTNVGVYVDGVKVKDNFLTTRVELQAGLSLANPQSISRISGIRLYA
jgi:hypothetical protein